jgi:hypothetical protein
MPLLFIAIMPPLRSKRVNLTISEQLQHSLVPSSWFSFAVWAGRRYVNVYLWWSEGNRVSSVLLNQERYTSLARHHTKSVSVKAFGYCNNQQRFFILHTYSSLCLLFSLKKFNPASFLSVPYIAAQSSTSPCSSLACFIFLFATSVAGNLTP